MLYKENKKHYIKDTPYRKEYIGKHIIKTMIKCFNRFIYYIAIYNISKYRWVKVLSLIYNIDIYRLQKDKAKCFLKCFLDYIYKLAKSLGKSLENHIQTIIDNYRNKYRDNYSKYSIKIARLSQDLTTKSHKNQQKQHSIIIEKIIENTIIGRYSYI